MRTIRFKQNLPLVGVFLGFITFIRSIFVINEGNYG